MEMDRLKVKDIVSILAVDLAAEFPDEQFLFEELERILGGLVNSIRWAILMDVQRSEQLNERIMTLETLDHFITEQMDRAKIVTRIKHTSGLNEREADYGLAVIEKTVDAALVESNRSIEIRPIGIIRASEQRPNGYTIDLAAGLQIGPLKARWA